MRILTLTLALSLVAGPTTAQLLRGGVGGVAGDVGGALAPVAGSLDSTVRQTAGAAPIGATPSAALVRRLANPLGVDPLLDGEVVTDARSLADQRRLRLEALIRSNRRTLEADPHGDPVRRGEVVASDLSDADLAAAQKAGFSVIRRGEPEAGSPAVVVLAPPHGMSLARALKTLRSAVPGGRFDYNSVFEPAGRELAPAGAAQAGAFPPGAPGAVIGLIDGGVAAHPALARAEIEQRGFAGPVAGTGHGTAVASLLVGDAPGFWGAARGARLLVADVYGGSPANGSAEAIARGMAWLTARGVKVINISLVGPPNLVVERAVQAARARGVLVVAAVGNDGPAAPPAYPASYDGVLAVTGVDAHDRALMEAGKPRHLDFAAPGADMAAALSTGGYGPVRGTSFAAPLVAARLAADGLRGTAGEAEARVTAEARPGHGAVGRGVVCETCRNDVRRLAQKNDGAAEEIRIAAR